MITVVKGAFRQPHPLREIASRRGLSSHVVALFRFFQCLNNNLSALQRAQPERTELHSPV